jgi:histidyl-tRNA synthetase
LAAFVVCLGNAGRAAGRDLVRVLRAAGLSADSAFADRPLKAQLRSADRTGASYAAILGDDEVADSVATLRRLSDGAQERVPLADVVNWLVQRTTVTG